MDKGISSEIVENKIYFIRGQKVMLDKDLAKLYRVETGNLNRAVQRNKDRFPSDFRFQLNEEEFANLIFQFGRSSWGGTRKFPFAFTEQGIAMLSGVLHSPRAVHVNIMIMRAFVRMRQLGSLNKEIAQKFKEFEVRLEKHDNQFKVVFEALRRMMVEESKPKVGIGFGA